MEPSAEVVPLLQRLRAAYPDSSGRRLREWLAAGRVRVAGRVARDPRALTSPAEVVVLGAPPAPVLAAPLRLVHEDEAVLVVDKPSGLLTVATDRERRRTLYHAVWTYLAAQRPPGRPFVVHRLDRETSGLVVLACSPGAKARLQAQFASREVERGYVALVEGRVGPDSGVLTSALAEGATLCVRSTRRPGQGRTAVTRYRVRERRRAVTLLDLDLGTGRRHQIRVQLAEAGHPVVGDREHGARSDPLRRLCLHATRLGFRHPATGKPVRFESPAPPAFGTVGR